VHGTAQENAPERVGRLKSPQSFYLDVSRLKTNLTKSQIYDNIYIESEGIKMKQIIGVILFLAALAGLMYLGLRHETEMSREAYNKGMCSVCGGEYHFSSVAHYKNGSDRFYYTCEDCGHTIMTYRIMK